MGQLPYGFSICCGDTTVPVLQNLLVMTPSWLQRPLPWLVLSGLSTATVKRHDRRILRFPGLVFYNKQPQSITLACATLKTKTARNASRVPCRPSSEEKHGMMLERQRQTKRKREKEREREREREKKHSLLGLVLADICQSSGMPCCSRLSLLWW